MSLPSTLRGSAAALALFLAARAAPDACVQSDLATDNLEESERAGARAVLAQALASHGVPVAPEGTGCTAVYRLSNVRLGASVTVLLSGPQGTRTMTVRTIEDLPHAYAQMVRSLLTGAALTSSSGAVDRANVTAAQAAPRRAEADNMGYARLGVAWVYGPGADVGPSLGLGFRHEVDHLGFDVSLNLAFAYDHHLETGSLSGSWMRLMGLWFFDAIGNDSPYAGLGLSWGGVRVWGARGTAGSSGIQGEVSLGWELLRASTIRVFVQVDATLPFYRLGGMGGEAPWVPTYALSIGGAAGGGGRVERVNVVP